MMMENKIRVSYDTEEQAKEVAEWLAQKCQIECGGTWYPHWHENLGWYPSARLDDPMIATVYVSNYHANADERCLCYHGGFVSEPGHSGWLDGESASGHSPLEVMLKSYKTIVVRAEKLKERLEKINALRLVVNDTA